MGKLFWAGFDLFDSFPSFGTSLGGEEGGVREAWKTALTHSFSSSKLRLDATLSLFHRRAGDGGDGQGPVSQEGGVDTTSATTGIYKGAIALRFPYNQHTIDILLLLASVPSYFERL